MIAAKQWESNPTRHSPDERFVKRMLSVRRPSRALPQATEDEIEELRRRLKQVEMERDILKKALSIFSRQT